MPSPTRHGRRAVVRVSRSALLDMLMAAIEAAEVPPHLRDQSLEKFASLNRISRRERLDFGSGTLPMSLLSSVTGLPVAGLLFGGEEVDDGLATVHIERMFPRSANRHDFGFWTSERSPAVMVEVARAAGAPYGIVGEFWSRPRLTETPADIARSRVYRLERARSTVPEFEGDRVALLMTVAHATDTAPMPPAPRGPAVQARVGAWEIWLSALLPHRRMPTQGPELVVEWPEFKRKNEVPDTGP